MHNECLICPCAILHYSKTNISKCKVNTDGDVDVVDGNERGV